MANAAITSESFVTRRMQAIEVSVNEHCDVVIGVEGLGNDAGDYVNMTPDQVDLVVEWLQEARDKARQLLAERE